MQIADIKARQRQHLDALVASDRVRDLFAVPPPPPAPPPEDDFGYPVRDGSLAVAAWAVGTFLVAAGAFLAWLSWRLWGAL